MNVQNNITFKAKPGANVLNIAKKEYVYSPAKIEKFIKLYKDTFIKNIDENTVVDLTPDNKYVFSNELFPNIKYFSDIALEIKEDLLQSFVQECPKSLARIERDMFKYIISKSINKGMSFQDLAEIAEGIKNDSCKNDFLRNLNVAERIKKEDPNSQLTPIEFDAMSCKLMEEEANTPGTKLYETIHSIINLSFE